MNRKVASPPRARPLLLVPKPRRMFTVHCHKTLQIWRRRFSGLRCFLYSNHNYSPRMHGSPCASFEFKNLHSDVLQVGHLDSQQCVGFAWGQTSVIKDSVTSRDESYMAIAADNDYRRLMVALYNSGSTKEGINEGYFILLAWTNPLSDNWSNGYQDRQC